MSTTSTLAAPILKVDSFNHMPLVRINAPAFYDDAAFVEWLNSPGVATWHHRGSEVGSYSDVFFTFTDGEGSDAPVEGDERPSIPANIWKQISDVLTPEIKGGECLVWLSNLRE